MQNRKTTFGLIALSLTVIMALPIFAADTYTPAPLQLLTQRIDEHDQQICDLDQRIRDLEESVTAKEKELAAAAAITPATPATPAPQYDFDGAVIVPGSKSITEKTVLAMAQRTPARTVARAAVRRLRTRAEISAAIRAAWTGRVYARMARGQNHLVYQHLTGQHGYTSAQVVGLPLSEALMLHNLAHGPRVSEYTSTTYVSASANSNCPNGQCPTAVQRVDVFVPTPTGGNGGGGNYVPPSGGGNCPNGQCARRGSAASSRWYPGKLLFGR